MGLRSPSGTLANAAFCEVVYTSESKLLYAGRELTDGCTGNRSLKCDGVLGSGSSSTTCIPILVDVSSLRRPSTSASVISARSPPTSTANRFFFGARSFSGRKRGEVQRSADPSTLQELSSQWRMTFATIRRFQRLTPAACGAGEVALEGPGLVSACAVLTAEKATVPASSTRFTFCPREGDR